MSVATSGQYSVSDALAPASRCGLGMLDSAGACVPIGGRPGITDRMCRSAVLRVLQRIRHDRLLLQDADQHREFGGGDDRGPAPVIRVRSPAFYRHIVRGGTLGAARAWIDGLWDAEDLTGVFQVLLRNQSALEGFRSATSMLSRGLARLRHAFRSNTRAGSRSNIHEHYDLGNAFFSLFLDPTMMYSSGYFPHADATMEQASVAKLNMICDALQLGPDDHVMEIGTGWGGFAVHAARTRGCRVTTTTISAEQYAFARRRIAEAGLAEQVQVLQADYRDLRGRYSKLVSIEMVEAVGRRFLPQYFRVCEQLLQPGGSMLLQAITIAEQRSAAYSRSTDFIQRYIFPGGYLPSISQMQACVRDRTSLQLQSLVDFGLHYARTLQCWNAAFMRRLEDVRQQGFTDSFVRMWRYYLHYCEAAFLERATGVVHAVWRRPEI